MVRTHWRERLVAASLVTLSVAATVSVGAGAAQAVAPTTPEVRTVRAVTPTITATINALEAGDLSAARLAEQQYNILWHGVEVYLNYRSKPTYDVLEGDIQNRLETELAKPDANAQTALGIANELRAKYDEVIAISEAGDAISPLFDDLQVLRMNRAYLAQGVVADLNSGSIARARSSWATFASGYPTSLALIRTRSTTAADELEAAFAAGAAAFSDPTVSLAALKPVAAAVNTKMGVGVSLLNAAARGAVPTKKKITTADLTQLKTLDKVRVALNKVVALRRAADPAAVDAAATATGPAFEAIKPTLAAKNGADVALATALTNVQKLATPTSDMAAFETAQTAANNAILVAQQVIAGQFWGDAKVQKLITTLRSK